MTEQAQVKVTFRPPDRFALGDNPVRNWKIFRQRWQNYEVVTDISAIELPKKKAMFLHCLEDDALEAYNTFQLGTEATIEEILARFDKFIIGEVNETYERFNFNKRVQESGEKFEIFYTELQRLLSTCNYCESCKESILKDRIVMGINDSNLQKDLLKIRNLSLQMTIDTCRANENARSQNAVMQMRENGHVHTAEVNRLDSTARTNVRTCKFCGTAHKWGKNLCPAYNKTCSACGKANHFAKVCNSKSKMSGNNDRKNKSKYEKKSTCD